MPDTATAPAADPVHFDGADWAVVLFYFALLAVSGWWCARRENKDTDDYYLGTVRRGRVRNGAVYMPPFEGMISQEAMWSIKAYLETRREKPF